MFKAIALTGVIVSAVSAAVVPRASVSTTVGVENTDGYATYYYQVGAYGACGNINPGSGSPSLFSPEKCIIISAVIADNWPGCRNSLLLDLSVGAWKAVGQRRGGRHWDSHQLMAY